MNATEELKKEHRGIETMLAIANAISERLESGQTIPSDHLKKVVEFFQVFADKCHHGKEEDLLFGSMIAAGFPAKQSPIQVMLEEHTQGRKLVQGMADAANAYALGDSTAALGFAKNARDYSRLLSLHIQKEDQVLYPMADRLLPEKEQERLCREFERVEVERIGKGKHEEFHRLLHTLKQEYLG